MNLKKLQSTHETNDYLWQCHICNAKLNLKNPSYKKIHFSTKKCMKARQQLVL